MSERLQTDVPDEFAEWMRKNAPASAEMSTAELTRFWLQYARRQHELEVMQATKSKPNSE